MKKKYILPLLGILLLFVVACSDDNEVDTEKPVIDISFADAFPTNCDTIYFGETFVLKMKFSDNVELGAYSIDIHNNFDHHSHSTEVSACEPDPDKDPVNPFVSIDDFTIPEGAASYETNLTISIPENDGTELFDEGDYHFYIGLTDKEGWSAQKGLTIKMLYR
ncbi:DUF4625 domain-containing protein [Draconibacterium sp. IB214405]|uniref:DUF4625 domain-containing protein n=1 Tax=Draconibacterium sp. IB214405 TaxID=3097352 RepID=UPI002A14BB4A|nr:DUF4625 domain-containing protein [Draconibacterium sp. IB214405]MDX8340243.1 DUF4625 domain-containing protein [Draconibacterium sp. IB214405]